MDNIFILNPSVTILNLKDAIDERLTKTKAIANCLLTQDCNHYESNNSILHGVLWAIDDYLSEIECLIAKLLQN